MGRCYGAGPWRSNGSLFHRQTGAFCKVRNHPSVSDVLRQHPQRITLTHPLLPHLAASSARAGQGGGERDPRALQFLLHHTKSFVINKSVVYALYMAVCASRKAHGRTCTHTHKGAQSQRGADTFEGGVIIAVIIFVTTASPCVWAGDGSV